MKITTKIFLFFGILCLIHSCTKKEFEGPLIETLYADFELIESLLITNKNPNFSSNEQVSFHCEFNKPVQWKISILGLSTNASRIITGFSSLIDSNNIIWNGGPSQIPFFSEEECIVELTIENLVLALVIFSVEPFFIVFVLSFDLIITDELFEENSSSLCSYKDDLLYP